ncbi:hypothetical protein [Streptomyces sp. 1222.5]|uniref:hypothetical protein n=1 Tax=Streptomyces sp. 1222.5 TaxID=1881026 RepID=UPI003D742080
MSHASRIELAFKTFGAQVAVSEDIALELIDVRVQREVFGQMLFQLRMRVLTDSLPPEQFSAQTRVTYEVPASTWQMWKKRHAHRWYARCLVARWPVRYVPDPDGRGTTATCTASLERYRAYPHARVQLPDHFGRAVLAYDISAPRWNLSGGDDA